MIYTNINRNVYRLGVDILCDYNRRITDAFSPCACTSGVALETDLAVIIIAEENAVYCAGTFYARIKICSTEIRVFWRSLLSSVWVTKAMVCLFTTLIGLLTPSSKNIMVRLWISCGINNTVITTMITLICTHWVLELTWMLLLTVALPGKLSTNTGNISTLLHVYQPFIWSNLSSGAMDCRV